MSGLTRFLMVLILTGAVVAQSPAPPLDDMRLTIHTLVREDIFAGFLVNDLERFSRGEKNIRLLMEKRASAKPELLAWQGGATLYRAVRALENKQPDEFQQKYQQALDLFAQARESSPQNGGVAAVTGGSYVVFADRLPKEKRTAAWQDAWDAFQILWKQQESVVDKLPVHIRGELLGGLAMSAQRTGRTEESNRYLDQILTVLKDTPYESVARKWKNNPEAAAAASITCMTCHEPGRLGVRISALGSK